MSRLLILLLMLISYTSYSQFIPPTEGEFDTTFVNTYTLNGGSTGEGILILDIAKVDAFDSEGFLFIQNNKEVFIPVDSIQNINLKSASGRDIYMERVAVDHVTCDNDVSDEFEKSSYLLQLATTKDTTNVKVYVIPGFREGGRETYPFGLVDPIGLEEYEAQFEEGESIPPYFEQGAYYIKVNDMPARRVTRWGYLDCGPYLYQNSTSFLKRYFLPKINKKASKGKKRSKRETKKRTSAEGIVKLEWEDIPTHIKEYDKLYKYDVERKSKRRR